MEELKGAANALFSKGEYDSALDMYTKGIGLYPDAHVLYSNRALVFLRRCKEGDAAKALSDAEEAVRLAPSWPRGYLRACSAAEAMEDWGLAAFWAARGLRECPGEAALVGARSRAVARRDYAVVDEWSAKKRWDLVVTLLDRVVENAPEFGEAYGRRAMALLERDAPGDVGRALGDATKWTTLAPRLGMAHVTRARVLLMMGRYDDAVKAAIQAQSVDPINPAVHAALSHAREWAADSEKASAMREKDRKEKEVRREGWVEEERKRKDEGIKLPQEEEDEKIAALAPSAKSMDDDIDALFAEAEHIGKKRPRETSSGGGGDGGGGGSGVGVDGDGIALTEEEVLMLEGMSVADLRSRRTPKQLEELDAKVAAWVPGKPLEEATRLGAVKHAEWENANPFRVLHLPPEATVEQIRERAKKMRTIVHPDRAAAIRDADPKVFQAAFNAIDTAEKALLHPLKRKLFEIWVLEARAEAKTELENRTNRRKQQLARGVGPGRFPPPLPSLEALEGRAIFRRFTSEAYRRKVADEVKAQRKKEEEEDAAEEAKRSKEEKEAEEHWEETRKQRTQDWRSFQEKFERGELETEGGGGEVEQSAPPSTSSSSSSSTSSSSTTTTTTTTTNTTSSSPSSSPPPAKRAKTGTVAEAVARAKEAARKAREKLG